jgi:hypothetical protein
MCMQVMCNILLKSSRKRIQLCFNLTSIENLHKKLQASKVLGVPILGISRLQLPRQNDIWVQPPWLITKNIIRGRWWLPSSPGHGESRESVYARDLFVH